jgi:hypothetical protein
MRGAIKMLQVSDLNNIAKLEKDYKYAQDSLNSSNHDDNINFILNNSKRKVIERILQAAKYQALATLHNQEIVRDNQPPITIDLYTLAIQTDGEQSLKNILLRYNSSLKPGLIADFYREVREQLIRLSLSNDNTTILEQIRERQSRQETAVHDSKEAYDSAIESAIRIINSALTARKLAQLILSNTTDDDTIGHLCLRGDFKHQALYSNLLLTLNSNNILSLLYCRNRNGVSILDLFVKTNYKFLTLAAALNSNDLYSLLSNDNFFIKIVTIKKHVPNFLQDYLQLLKEKCNEDQLSQLLNLNCESLAPADNGWTIGHGIIKQHNAALVLEYIDLLSRLPKDKLQHRLNQPDLYNNTFIKLILNRIDPPLFQKSIDTPTERVTLVVKLLETVPFDPDTIRSFADISRLKAEVTAYLLELPPNQNTFNLLQDIINKNNGLGLFCWEWRRAKASLRGLKTSFFSDSTQPDEPTTIRTLRDRLNELDRHLCSNKLPPSAPPLPEAILNEPTLTVARLLADDETQDLNIATAILLSHETTARPETTTGSTDHSFMLAVLAIILLALYFKYYLQYSNNHHDDEVINRSLTPS